MNQGVSAELIAQKWGFSRERPRRVLGRVASAGGGCRGAGPTSTRSSLPVADRSTASSTPTRRSARGTTTEGLAALNPAFRTDELAARFPELEWTHHARQFVTADGCCIRRPHHERGEGGRARAHAAGALPFVRRGRATTRCSCSPGPIPATRRILERSGLSLDDLDAYEVNEAFASVPLAWAKELGADPAKLNPWGGAIALGHAVGASGTRLLGTLVAHLEATGGRYGLQTMCEGGGMANADDHRAALRRPACDCTWTRDARSTRSAVRAMQCRRRAQLQRLRRAGVRASHDEGFLIM